MTESSGFSSLLETEIKTTVLHGASFKLCFWKKRSIPSSHKWILPLFFPERIKNDQLYIVVIQSLSCV